jgi:predicted nuclease of predicted toxin-antitoxin system
VRLLFDQNLPRSLVTQLRRAFPDSQHVSALGLDTATDREIWEHARSHSYAIVSKDSDFRQLAFLYGPPPKVVWLRVGNASVAQILEVLRGHVAVIESFEVAEEEALLVIPALAGSGPL